MNIGDLVTFNVFESYNTSKASRHVGNMHTLPVVGIVLDIVSSTVCPQLIEVLWDDGDISEEWVDSLDLLPQE